MARLHREARRAAREVAQLAGVAEQLRQRHVGVQGAAALVQSPGSLVTSPGLDGVFGTADDKQVFYIPNVTPDFGITAPFWVAFAVMVVFTAAAWRLFSRAALDAERNAVESFA